VTPSAPITATPIAAAGLAGAEALLEDLDLAEEALANLIRLSGADEARLRTAAGWSARVELDDTPLLLVAEGDRWSILAPPDADVSDAMLAARRLHARLGEAAEGWDLDR